MRDADGRYRGYVLGVLVLVYVFNFLDRQILSILAERIKHDLHVSDAQLGFLYGTAFAIFYALFGIPLGRLADVWDRRRLIALGLAVWSGMTALSGLARSFGDLAVARIGVGVGEASATPAAHSLLSDYYPPARRATVLAIYASGIYIGAGLGLGIGGLIVVRWDAAWAGATPPFGLAGWQVAFLSVGLPGLLLALWVRTLREPVRGQSEGLAPAPPEPHPFCEFARELAAVLPPFTIFRLASAGAGGAMLLANLLAAAAIAAVAALVVRVIGDPAQWTALGIGVYSAVSWAQTLVLRDRPTAMMLRAPTLLYAAPGFALLSFVGYGVGFWTPPYFVRVHGIGEGEAGLVLGGTAAVAGWFGTTLGGVLADRWRARHQAARLYIGMIGGALSVPLATLLFTTDSKAFAYVLNFPTLVAVSLWIGPAASTVQDLVLPRMRGTASAALLLVITFIGLALGPYAIGRLSVALADLRLALLCALVADVLAVVLLAFATVHLPRDEAARARAAAQA